MCVLSLAQDFALHQGFNENNAAKKFLIIFIQNTNVMIKTEDNLRGGMLLENFLTRDIKKYGV